MKCARSLGAVSLLHTGCLGKRERFFDGRRMAGWRDQERKPHGFAEQQDTFSERACKAPTRPCGQKIPPPREDRAAMSAAPGALGRLISDDSPRRRKPVGNVCFVFRPRTSIQFRQPLGPQLDQGKIPVFRGAANRMSFFLPDSISQSRNVFAFGIVMICVGYSVLHSVLILNKGLGFCVD